MRATLRTLPRVSSRSRVGNPRPPGTSRLTRLCASVPPISLRKLAFSWLETLPIHGNGHVHTFRLDACHQQSATSSMGALITVWAARTTGNPPAALCAASSATP